MIHVPTNTTEVDASLPGIAVDLSGAYSVGKAATGFASSQWGTIKATEYDLTQTKAVEMTVSCLQRFQTQGAAKVNLILEAPLSWAVASQDASSDARLREIEKPSSYPRLHIAPNKVRPWNCNAGASTALMALIFLADLFSKISSGPSINLFEGFWSWMQKPKSHSRVALDLLGGLKIGGKRVVRLPDSMVSYRTTLQLLGIPAENGHRPPLVILGHKTLADAYQSNIK